MNILKKIKEKSEKDNFPYFLFLSLILYYLIPFIYEIIKSKLDINSNLNLLRNIRLFDLLNQGLQTFLIIPLYSLLNKYKREKENLKRYMPIGFVLITSVCLILSIFIIYYNNKINFTIENLEISFLNIEILNLILFAFLNFCLVIFIILEKEKYIYTLTITKVIFLIICDLFFFLEQNEKALVFSNILVNSILVLICLLILYKEKLICSKKELKNVFINNKDLKKIVLEYFRIGILSFGQFISDSIIYFFIFLKMIETIEQKNGFLVANNFILYFLLIPTLALGFIIRKDNKEKDSKKELEKHKKYLEIAGCCSVFMFLFIPFLYIFLQYIIEIENYVKIGNIILMLMIFYSTYPISIVYDNIFISQGKTYYLIINSLIVNLIYYRIVYVWIENGVLNPNLYTICLIYGIGLLIHCLLSYIFYKYLFLKEDFQTIY